MRFPVIAPALAPALALLVASVAPDPAAAAPKKGKGAGKGATPACGAKVLPLVVGNTWTYTNVAPPTPAEEMIARIAPNPPKTFTITVTKVEAKGGDTVVWLDEKLQYDASRDPKKPKPFEKTLTTSIICNAKGKFDIAPTSFFFAGEPGGIYNIEFDQLARKKETSLKLVKGGIGEGAWVEEIEAHFVRSATDGTKVTSSPGTLQLERKFEPQEPETIITKLGRYTAEKLILTTTGRVKLDKPMAPDGKSCRIANVDAKGVPDGTWKLMDVCDMPGGWVNQLWLVEEVGLVQALNKYAHMYQLTASTLN